MAMGAKTGKPPLLKKVKFFAQKIRLTLKENICVQKDYFRATKKLGVGLTPPTQKFFFKKKYVFSNDHLKKRIFAKKNF